MSDFKTMIKMTTDTMKQAQSLVVYCDYIANSIKQRLDGASVIAHVEPCDGRCGRPCDRMPPQTATPQAPAPSTPDAKA